MISIGAIATTAALTYGIWTFAKGDERMSQMMMRARVGAQAFTLIAIVGGIILSTKPKT